MRPRRRAAVSFGSASNRWHWLPGLSLALAFAPACAQFPGLPAQPAAIACGMKTCPPPSDPFKRDGFVLRLSGASHFDYGRGSWAQMPIARPMVPASVAERQRDEDPVALNATGDNDAYEGRYAAAREAFEDALRRSSDGHDPQVEAASLSNLGVVAAAQGRYDEARNRMEAAAKAYAGLEKAVPSAPPTAASEPAAAPSWLSRLGVDVRAIGRDFKAQFDAIGVDAERQAAFAGTVRTLLNQGNLAAHLGQYAQAESRFEQALDQVSKRPGQAGAKLVHGELFAFYRKVGKADLAAEQLRRAQAAAPAPSAWDGFEVGAIALGAARPNEAVAANVPAGAGPSSGTSNETLDKRPSHFAEASQQRLVAEAADRERANDLRGASDIYSRAALLAAVLDSPDRQRTSLAALQRLAAADARQPSAIFFGKRAVNAVQKMRQSLGELDRQARQSFLADKKRTYAALAQLLLDANRLAEAEQVLRLLKEDEGQQFLRTSATSPRGTLSYSVAETGAGAAYERLAGRTRALEAERNRLRRGSMTAAQQDTQAGMEQARRDEVAGADRLITAFERFDPNAAKPASPTCIRDNPPKSSEPTVTIGRGSRGAANAAEREARTRETEARMAERTACAGAIAAKPAAGRSEEETQLLREYLMGLRFLHGQLVNTDAGLRAFRRDARDFATPVSAAEAATVDALQARLDRVNARVEPMLTAGRDLPQTSPPDLPPFFAAAFGGVDAALSRLWGIDRELEDLDAERARLDAGLAVALAQPNNATFSAADSTSLDAGRRLFESLPAGTVALYYLAGEQRLDILAVDRRGRRASRADVTSAALDERIRAYRHVLQDARLDAVVPARELYELLVAPVAETLRDAKATTLMLALDGQLRYLPFAALHDGQGWLAERYAIDLYTTATPAALTAVPAPKWRAAAFGSTTGGAGFSALPSVKLELEGIVRDPALHTDGVLPGMIRLDRNFTAAALRSALRERQNVVHIASHFAFREGDPGASFLLLGDGDRLSLAQLNGADYRFDRVDLVTLSACETALSGDDSFGQEVEGLGTLLQGQGAAAVLATLWSVNDDSTAQFMRTLYGLRERRGLSRAQAVREAQLTFIRGGGVASTADDRRGASRPGSMAGAAPLDPARPYAHPYYWAPFVLMGNWL